MKAIIIIVVTIQCNTTAVNHSGLPYTKYCINSVVHITLSTEEKMTHFSSVPLESSKVHEPCSTFF